MSNIESNIIKALQENPGLSDRELSVALRGHDKLIPYVNQSCRTLENRQMLLRKKRKDNLIGNWLSEKYVQQIPGSKASMLQDAEISEKRMKQSLEKYLISDRWEPKIDWGEGHGNDIEARRGSNRWVIEVKGSVSNDPLKIKNFLAVLGEILQRMDDPDCKYSIALPDLDPFRRMWVRLPSLAKSRTGITALFIDSSGLVTEVDPP